MNSEKKFLRVGTFILKKGRRTFKITINHKQLLSVLCNDSQQTYNFYSF